MFTGIVEELGRVGSFETSESGAKLRILCHDVMSDVTIGASIAVNGVCLTAVTLNADGFGADLAPETLDRSNLGELTVGDPVNLERPVTLATRLSGHIVQGHVDGTGVIEAIVDRDEDNREVYVRVPDALDPYLVYKGSIAIDGISLTIASVTDRLVKIAIIPHTWAATNLATRAVGSRVNVECDVLAKHVAKLLGKLTI
ncbi:MAG: riboflavin synthase, alpha subunit [Bryobacterales bacterium]|nr:riboflavin synthase, alpha subunit [Bryobacterales bacterium]